MPSVGFSTDTPQSAWGPGEAVTFSDTFSVRKSFSGDGTIGGIATSIDGFPVPKSGAQVGVSASGSIGVDLSYQVTAGEIDPTLKYNISADVPVVNLPYYQHYLPLAKIETQATLVDGAINSVSPSVAASIEAYLDLNVRGSAEACILGACASVSGELIDIDNKTLELIGTDGARLRLLKGVTDLLPVAADISLPVGEVEAVIQRGTPVPSSGKPAIGVSVNTVPLGNYPESPYIDLASVKVEVPTIEVEGSLNGGVVSGDGSDRLVTAYADLDGILDQIPAGGATFSVGNSDLNAAITIEAYDFKAGPTLDLYQEFSMETDLYVQLDFDPFVIPFEKVHRYSYINGHPNYLGFDWVSQKWQTSWTGLWEDVPWIYFPRQSTTVTPTFFTKTMITSETGLQFGLEAKVLAGQVKANIGVGASLQGSFGPLVEETFSASLDFARFSLFDETFELEGMNRVQADPFFVTVNRAGGFEGPGAVEYPSAVPGPPALLSLMGAFGVLGLRKRRKASASRQA